MADTPAPDGRALTARLVTGRLTAPGIIDRGAVQRTVERLSRPASAHALDRLQRRAVVTAAGSDPLVLAHSDRGDGTADHAPADVAASATSGTAAPAASAATASAPGAPAARLLARQALGTGRAAERVAARVTRPAGASGAAPLVARLAARGSVSGAPTSSALPTSGAASAPALQRSAATVPGADLRADGGIVAPLGSGAGLARVDASTASPSPVVRRSAERAAPRGADAATPVPAERRSVTRELVAPAAPPSGGIAASMPLLQRAPASEPRASAAGALAPSRTPLVGAGPSAPLLLRRPERSIAGQSQPRAPSIMARTAGVISRAEAAPVTALAPKAAPDGAAPAWAGGDAPDMDWIVEQVGRRLARRLEVERERQGSREWRQPS